MQSELSYLFSDDPMFVIAIFYQIIIAQFICDIDFDSEVQVNLFTDTHWHTNFAIEALADSSLGQNFKHQITDLKALDKSETIKIVFWGEHEKLTAIYKQLQQQLTGKVNLTFSLPQCLEVMDANTNKGSAVHALLKHKNLTMADTIAFGDGMKSELADPVSFADQAGKAEVIYLHGGNMQKLKKYLAPFDVKKVFEGKIVVALV